MVQTLNIIFIGILGVLVFAFGTSYRKELQKHRRNVRRLKEKISFEKGKIQYRFQHLNLYNFLKYNLKEALGN
jgi:hypothetical protein